MPALFLQIQIYNKKSERTQYLPIFLPYYCYSLYDRYIQKKESMTSCFLLCGANWS